MAAPCCPVCKGKVLTPSQSLHLAMYHAGFLVAGKRPQLLSSKNNGEIIYFQEGQQHWAQRLHFQEHHLKSHRSLRRAQCYPAVSRGQRAHVWGHSPAVVRVRSLCGMTTATTVPARAAWLGHPCGLCSPGGSGCSARHRRLVTVAPGCESLPGWSSPGLWVLFALGRSSSDAFRGLDSLFCLAGQPQLPCNPC